jgi:putative YphP/YqiW family bacilliredoxin
MPYPEFFVEPMRLELTQLGVEELRTPEQVDAAVAAGPGTLMIVVNSVCGCAAGKARPGVALALRHSARPDRIATVFAGADVDHGSRPDSKLTGSPLVAVDCHPSRREARAMLERRNIENHATRFPSPTSSRGLGQVLRASANDVTRLHVISSRLEGQPEGVRGYLYTPYSSQRCRKLVPPFHNPEDPVGIASAIVLLLMVSACSSSEAGPHATVQLKGADGRRRRAVAATRLRNSQATGERQRAPMGSR